MNVASNRSGRGLTAMVFLFVVGSVAFGQATQLGGPTDTKKVLLFNMLQGTEAVNRKTVGAAAKYYAYRATWPANVIEPEKVARDLDDVITQIMNSKNFNKARTREIDDFIKVFGEELVVAMKEVTDLPVIENSRSQISAGQMFVPLARLQTDAVDNYFSDLVKFQGNERKGHDVVRFWALRGMREMFPVKAWGEPVGIFELDKKSNIARKAADLARVKALSEFILRPAPTTTTSEEQLAAFHYLRRDAIETLSHAGYPAVNALKPGPAQKNAKVEGEIALVLMKVLVPGALNPDSTPLERAEAGIGLCQMKMVELYDPTPTYYFMGRSLIDLGRYAAENPKGTHGKVLSKRWELAIKELRAGATKESQARAAEFERKSVSVLAAIATGGDPKHLNELEIIVNKWAPPAAPIVLFDKRIESTPIVDWKGP